MVERGGLENRCTRERTVGSNPTPSASTLVKFATSLSCVSRKRAGVVLFRLTTYIARPALLASLDESVSFCLTERGLFGSVLKAIAKFLEGFRHERKDAVIRACKSVWRRSDCPEFFQAGKALETVSWVWHSESLLAHHLDLIVIEWIILSKGNLSPVKNPGEISTPEYLGKTKVSKVLTSARPAPEIGVPISLA